MAGEGDAIADMLVQMRQLAEDHPEAAQRLAVDLTAALGRAGMHFDGQNITDDVPAMPGQAAERGVASEVAAEHER